MKIEKCVEFILSDLKLKLEEEEKLRDNINADHLSYSTSIELEKKEKLLNTLDWDIEKIKEARAALKDIYKDKL